MKKKFILFGMLAAFALSIVLINTLDKEDKKDFLTLHGFENMSTREVINTLDKGQHKSGNLLAQISSKNLVIEDVFNKYTYSYKDEPFYLSIAPYIDNTHPCFDHVPTSCQGELVNKDITVQVINDKNEVVYSENTKTLDNGFAGIWLPRNMKGTISVQYDGKVAVQDISTFSTDGTCLTDLRLI